MDSRADQISAHPRPMLGGKSSIFILQLYIEFYSCPLSKKKSTLLSGFDNSFITYDTV